MKQLNYIGIICAMALITAPAVADIASAEYVEASLGTKLSNNATGNNLAIGSGAHSISYNGAPDKNIAIGYGASAENNDDWTQAGISIGSEAKSLSGIAIGNGAYAANDGTIAIGEGVKTNSDDAIAIGAGASTGDIDEIAIGIRAKVGADASGAIQLGSGTNNVPGTFNVYLYDGYEDIGGNYRLLDANGKIPAERLTNAPTSTLATSTGQSTTAGMTQKAITDALNNKQNRLPTGPNDGKKYSLIWNGTGFAFEEFTSGSGSGSITGTDWVAIANYLDASKNPTGQFSGAYHEVDYDDTNLDWCSTWSVNSLDPDDSEPWWYVRWGGSDCSGLQRYEWKINIPSLNNTEIKGATLCSSTNGTYNQPGNPSDTSGQYCWCKITAPSASRWVFVSDMNDDNECLSNCTDYCGADMVLHNPTFLSSMINSIGQ